MKPIRSKLPLGVSDIVFGLLAIQAFVVFLTGTKFILEIENNVGFFEVNAIFLIGAIIIYCFQSSLSVRLHPILIILALWVFAAMLSLTNLSPDRFIPSIIHIIILLFQLILAVCLFNLLSLHQKYLLFLLRCLAISAAIISIWVLLDQIVSGGNYLVSGPFRNFSHTSIYMFGALWAVLCYLFWPNISRWEHWVGYLLLVPVLYGVVVGGRRSVYVALIVGLSCLALSAAIMQGRQRFKVSGTAFFILCFLAILYFRGDQYLKPLTFFKDQVGTIPKKIGEATAFNDDPEVGESFPFQQRQGALQAFKDHPIIGIGWNGFYGSKYSPTGHEMHSTPLRFLAELGLVGFILYLSFTILLLFRAFRLFLLVRRTPYQLSALILFAAFCSSSVSYYYNRMFTDRIFWLLLTIFLGFEAVMLNQITTVPTPITQPVIRTSPKPQLTPADH